MNEKDPVADSQENNPDPLRDRALPLDPRYELIRELGSGGTGRVFLVRDLYLDREVALKLLHSTPSRVADLEPFRREFALLSEIEHPCVARAYDFGFVGDRPYFTSEFVEGRTLASRVGTIQRTELFAAALAVAEALAFLPSNRILHLDVKPGNIVVPGPSSGRGAVLIDFGLFRQGAADLEVKLGGSLPYMAPECFREAPLSAATDVYAFGAAFYRVLTGSFPRRVGEQNGGEERDATVWSPVLPLPSRAASAAPELDAIVLKCLALDPNLRYKSAQELLDALQLATGRKSVPSPKSASLSLTVGRSRELDEAADFLEGVQKRSPRSPVLLVTAAPGMGQTQFIRAVKVEAQTRGLKFYVKSGHPHRSETPGSLLSPLSIHLRGDDSAAWAQWDAFLARLRRPMRESLAASSTEGERRMKQASAVVQAACSVREPMVVAADGLQYFDEVSLALLVDLARFLCESPSGKRPPVGLLLGFREEGTSVELLRELTGYLFEEKRASVITLGPLDVNETLDLYRRNRGSAFGTADALSLYQRTGGSPAGIIALTGRWPVEPDKFEGRRPPRTRLDVSREARAVFLCLTLLERPASTAEIVRLTGHRGKTLSRVLDELQEKELAARTPEADAWTAGKAAAAAAPVSAGESRRMHRKIAGEIARRARDDSKLVEAVRHYVAAGAEPEIARYGLRAARYLKATFQSRAALDLFRAIFTSTPSSRAVKHRAARIGLALEIAGLHYRLGEIDEGIRILRAALPQARRASNVMYARAILNLATLYSRRGDFQRADSLFQEGMATAGRGKRLDRRERLLFLNEHASLKVVIGEYDEALWQCEEGLRETGRSRDAALREIALNLHATRANVHLRRYEYPQAIKSFEASLNAAEAIGSQSNQAAILNNLGIVYNQCDRYPEAISAFRSAERTSIEVDEGPSLVSIHGNLAVLFSKLGDFASMEKSLEAGERLMPGSMGRRHQLFMAHARGLARLNQGRHGDARGSFEESIRLAKEMGDRHILAFDELYFAEAALFRGEYAEAEHTLERLRADTASAHVRRAAISRLALLSSLTGRPVLALETASRHAASTVPRAVPFLDAWDFTFLAWAHSLAGRHDRVLSLLEEPARFFRSHGMGPGLSLVQWIQAESRLLSGTPGCEVGALGDLCQGSPANDFTAILYPLLEARLLLRASPGPQERSRAGDLLAEAGAALAANPLREWSEQHAALRALFLPGPGKDRSKAAGREPETATSSVREERSETPSREQLVSRSAGMRRLLATLNRVRSSDLPVLIRGETGTGKDLVARVLHAESRRAAGPFSVVDCATLPPALLEAELFGARRGAFTGIEEDRPGLLVSSEGGSVLIDEIGGASLDAQAKLLRVLAGASIRPLGSEAERRIDVRFLFSTSLDLEQECKEDRFRRDLLYRIRVLTLDVPPLRERPEDFPELVKKLLEESSGPPPVLAQGVLERLRERPWPGNIRELKNVLTRLRVENASSITLESLERTEMEPKTSTVFPRNLLAGALLPELKQQLERDYIVYHFRRLGSDTEALRKFLGLGLRQLYRRCARLGVVLRELKGEGKGRS